MTNGDAISRKEVMNLLYFYHVDKSNEDVIDAIEKLPPICGADKEETKG